MAEEHNAIKYGSTLSKAISTAVGGGYGDVGVSRVSETLGPQMDPWSRPEWELLRGEILYARHAVIGAVAARFSGIQMLLAPGASKICVVRIVKQITAALYVGIDTASTVSLANPTVLRGVACDARFPSVGQTSQTQIITGDGASTVALPQDKLDGTHITANSPFILVPGSSLFVLGVSVNTATEMTVFFSERTPFPGELQARG